jgi:hypothetical protein
MPSDVPPMEHSRALTLSRAVHPHRPPQAASSFVPATVDSGDGWRHTGPRTFRADPFNFGRYLYPQTIRPSYPYPLNRRVTMSASIPTWTSSTSASACSPTPIGISAWPDQCRANGRYALARRRLSSPTYG